MQSFLHDLPSWLQAISALFLVGLTAATLWVLCGYADDTKKIANVSASQTENSQMPFLAVILRPNHGGWSVQNQGSGPALNISYDTFQMGAALPGSITPLASGEVYELHGVVANAFANAIADHRVIDLRYNSLSGAQYRTIVRYEGNATRTEFLRPQG